MALVSLTEVEVWQAISIITSNQLVSEFVPDFLQPINKVGKLLTIWAWRGTTTKF